MKAELDLVLEFHSAFGIPVRSGPTAEIPEASMRHAIMAEENEEYREACEAGDVIAIADALGDQLYVLLGTILAHGMQDKIGEVLREIHRSNMSKLDADGRPIYREDGKILKSDRFFAPNLEPILFNNTSGNA